MLKRAYSGAIKAVLKPVRLSFSTKEIKNNKENDQPKNEETEAEETSVYSKEYDPKKYEVPTDKIKYASSYSLLEVEPFPNAKIMKLGYIMLEKLKTLPPKSLYRIYTEEKFRYIMNLVDDTENIRELEAKFGYESIEMFIQNLHDEIALFDRMKDAKVWEAREIDDEELHHFQKTPKSNPKYGRHDRPPREEKKFL